MTIYNEFKLSFTIGFNQLIFSKYRQKIDSKSIIESEPYSIIDFEF